MLFDLTPTERNTVQPAARAVALDFLQVQLDAVAAKIARREAYLARHSPAGETPPPEETETLHIYRREQALIGELMADCQEQLLPEALRRRLAAAQRRSAAQAGRPKSSPAARAERWQAEVEQQILTELLRQWANWLQGR